VIAAVSATLPVKPSLGVTVMVEVFLVIAPGLKMVTDVPLTVNPLTSKEIGTEGDSSPLLALMVRLYIPPREPDVVLSSKATCAYPPGRSVMLDCAKLQDAPEGRPEHVSWLNIPEYPSILCSVKSKGIDPPGVVLTDAVPFIDPPILAITLGVRFEFALAKYAFTVFTPRLAEIASKWVES
jgi:hypothetical protein